MPVKRRKAEDADKELCRKIHHECYLDVMVKQFGSWDGTMQDSYFDEGWSSHPHEVIELDGQAIGCLSIQEMPDRLYLAEIQILPEFQGKGIGSGLIREIQQQARDMSKSLRLRVLKENRAQSLYRRLGFQEVGRTDTHIWMEWPANEATAVDPASPVH